jgi:ClpP class serine protease
MKHLAHVASRFVGVPLMIHPAKLEAIIRAIGTRLGVDPAAVAASGVDASAELRKRYAQSSAGPRTYAIADGGIAVIPVQGVLLKKESFMAAWSGSSSYEQIQRQITSAVADAGVSAILLDIDSPGGETAGCFDLADYIFSARKEKPIWAVANDIALSAAYAIASSAERIWLNRTGAVGSIGVYALHMDQSGFDKGLGVKYTYIFAGDKKVDGNPHEPLSERAGGDVQAEVDREYRIFTDTVARNRGTTTDAITGTEAAVLWGENAIPLLADEVGTFDDAMEEMRGSGKARKSTAQKAMREQAQLEVRQDSEHTGSQERTTTTMKLESIQDMRELEAQAVAFARQNHGQVTAAMYVPGSTAKMTKERAYAQMLEEDPQLYEAYRNAHNARALVRTLEAAGIRLAR